MTSPTNATRIPSAFRASPVWSLPELREDPDLAARIAEHPLDKPGVAVPFSKRLADENGWPHAYALGVVEEYRRFIYLVCIAGEELTPSDEVDQVWHLHLAYSPDYWEVFCPKVLGRPLHHGPTEGGPDENSRYEGNYRRTLAIYQRVFHAAPPPDIWPPARIRFNPKARFVRVNRGLFSIRPLKSGSNFFAHAYMVLFAALFGLTTTTILAGVFEQHLPAIRAFTFDAVKILLPIVFVVGAAAALAPTLWKGARWLFRRGKREEVSQPQHGYAVTFAVVYGVSSVGSEVASVAEASSDASVSGDGSGEGGDGGGGGGDGGDGGGGCGGGGCGGGCGGG